MARSTSRVFACWRALVADLAAAPWTPHPTTGELPAPVTFCVPPQYVGEIVAVPGRKPQGGASQTRATQGAGSGKDEVFTLVVGVSTSVPGRTAEEAHDRLEELCDIVQRALRSSTTGLPIGDALGALAIPTLRWDVSDVTPAIYPISEGFAGDATLEVTFFTRI